MEDLTDAITSLKCLLEEQLNMEELAFVEDSPFLALKKMLSTTNDSLQDLNNLLEHLVDHMQDIVAIQKRALKWQEMSQ